MMKEEFKNYISFFKKVLSIGERNNENYIGYLKVKYKKSYKKLKNQIYERCDFHLPNESLSTFFYYSVDKFDKIPKRDLVFLASSILDKLVEENVLTIVSDPEKKQKKKDNVCRDTPYAFYKILPHKDLVKHKGFFEKKMKMLN